MDLRRQFSPREPMDGMASLKYPSEHYFMHLNCCININIPLIWKSSLQDEFGSS